jgi:GGDEF domain-containing protein
VNNENGIKSQNQPAAASTERVLWLLYALVGATILQSALVLLGNEVNNSVWLLVILAAGIGQGLLLPSRFAWFGLLGATVLWVMARQALGIWVQAHLLQSMLEVAGLMVGVVLAVRFRREWEPLQQERQDLLSLRQILLAGEAGTGLLSRQVAELRLAEEVDRARQFQRPVGLLLVEMEPLHQGSTGQLAWSEVQQAVIRQLVSASLVHDIPFRAEANRVGLILPERDWDSLYRDTESIVSALRQGLFIDGEGGPHEVVHHAALGFGLGTYQGEASGAIDLMRAAEDSLSVGRDLADIGETSVTAYAMPATPILDSGPISADEEE